jgi:hypothetical protein
MFNVLIAVVTAAVLLRAGVGVLRALAAPPPTPPPAGELRRVKFLYRCELCGTEVQMTTATEENPDPPRHCMEAMELLPIDD